MSLLGNTQTYGLTNVLKFLSDSQYSGRLRIYHKNRRMDLFLHHGNLRIPLGLSWRPLLSTDELRDQKKPPQGEAPKNLYHQVEIALYEIFFWEKANYVFDRDFLPEEIETGEGSRFIDINTGSLVMEAARRMDDIKRVANLIPKENRLFVFQGNLQDLDPNEQEIIQFVNGSRDVLEIVELSGKGLYEVVMLLARLFELSQIQPLTPEDYPKYLRDFVEKKDFSSAFHIYCHILRETGPLEPGTNPLFLNWDEKTIPFEDFKGAVSGIQAFYYIKDLLSEGLSVKLNLKGSQEYELWIAPEEFYIKKSGSFVKDSIDKLVRRKIIQPDLAKDLKEVPLLEDEHFNWILKPPLTPAAVLLSLGADEIAQISEEKNLHLQIFAPTDEKPRGALRCQMNPEIRKAFLYLLENWENLSQETPPDASILVLVRNAREKFVETHFPVIGEFLSHFHRNRLNVQELREKLSPTYGILGFYSNLMLHYHQGHLRYLDVEELKKLVTTEIMIENYPSAIRLIEAGKLRAQEEDTFFQEKLEEIRLKSEGDLVAEDDRLVGDLTSFSLAEVLQNLVTNQLTGTLRIFIPGIKEAKKEIYFEEGDIYLLKKESEASEATVSTFLDMEALEGLGSLAENQNSEEYLQEMAEVARQEIYELFLWEGATFTFILDALPPEIYHPDEKSLKLSLDADIFLMEAIGRLDMWMEISQVITTEKIILEFTSPEGKLQALAMGKNPQVVYMIDGIKNVEDLIRVSQMGKLEACSFLYELYQMGLVRPLTLAELILRGQEAYKRKDYLTSLKYYECAVRLNPKDERLHKIIAGLRKLKKQMESA